MAEATAADRLYNTPIHVAIRSYRRAGRVKTLRVAPFAFVWVPQSQAAEYREHYGDRVMVIPDAEDGGLARKSNAILNHSPAPWTLIMDDDITGVGYWEAGGHHWMQPDELELMIRDSFFLAAEMGVRLWGVNQGTDEMWHYSYRPLYLLAPILGPFNGHLEPELRYDEQTGGKEDYDFWLQNIQRYRKTLRLGKFHYLHDHARMSGGFVSMRTHESETEAGEYLKRKWGAGIFRGIGGTAGGRRATGKNILNSQISIPIAGC